MVVEPEMTSSSLSTTIRMSVSCLLNRRDTSAAFSAARYDARQRMTPHALITARFMTLYIFHIFRRFCNLRAAEKKSCGKYLSKRYNTADHDKALEGISGAEYQAL